MTEPAEQWSQFETRFGDLALKLKYHFEQEVGRPTTDEGVGEAVKEVAEALKGTVDAVGNAVRDEAVRDDARDVGMALVNALTATVQELSDAARESLSRSTDDDAD